MKINKIKKETPSRVMVGLEDLTDSKCDYRNAQFVSYGTEEGKITGNFRFDISKLSTLIVENNFLSQYTLTEKITPYFKMVWDIDVGKDKMKPFFEKYDYQQFEKYLLDKIVKGMAYYIDPDCLTNHLEYLYSDKGDDLKGVHLVFPNLIVDKWDAIMMRWKVIEALKVSKEYEFTDDILKDLLDYHIYGAATDKNENRGHFRLNHQYLRGTCYKINKEKSTYKNIPDDIAKQIVLTSVNVYDNRKQNFVYKCENDISLMHIDRQFVINDHKKNGAKPKDFNKKDKEGRKKAREKVAFVDECKDALYQENMENKLYYMEIAHNISDKYLDPWDSWVRILLAMRREGLYELFDEISAKNKKYDPNEVEREMRRLDRECDNPVTIATVMYYSKKSNPREHLNIQRRYGKCFKLKYVHSDDILLENSENCYNKSITEFDPENPRTDRLIKEQQIKHKDNPENVGRISDWTFHLMATAEVLIFHAHTGLGKTTATKKVIADELKKNSKASILSIVSRQTMAQLHADGFKEFGLKSYMNDNNKGNPRYIISMEQLFLIERDYDILILDEVTSLLWHLYSPTMDKVRFASFSKLNRLVTSAKRLILCDAIMTTMTLRYISSLRHPDQILYYRNMFANKNGKVMNVYYRKNNGVNKEIELFMLKFKDKIVKGEEVFIMSDSKTTVDAIYKFALENWNPNKDYYKLITSDFFDINEDVQEEWVGKCVLISPKVVYGLDCLIKYEEIYAIYHGHTINSFCMIQQVGRSRNALTVNVLFTEMGYDRKINWFKTLKQHGKEEDEAVERYIHALALKHSKKSVDEAFKAKYSRYELLDEMKCICDDNGKIRLDNGKVFSMIHLYKSYYDKIFNRNKSELMLLFCKEQGYEIKTHELPQDVTAAVFKRDNSELQKELADLMLNVYMDPDEMSYNIKKLEDEDGDIQVEDLFLENIEDKVKRFDKDYKYLNVKEALPQLEEVQRRRLEMINLPRDELWRDSRVAKILADNRLFDTIIRCIPLYYKKEIVHRRELNGLTQGFPQICKENKVYDRLQLIELIENHCKIDRFDIEGIDLNPKQIILLRKALKEKENLWHCLTVTTGKEKMKAEIMKRVGRLTTNNMIQKFLADCYNMFADLIKYDKKRQGRKQLLVYYDFELDDEVMTDHFCLLHHMGTSSNKIIDSLSDRLSRYYYNVYMFD